MKKHDSFKFLNRNIIIAFIITLTLFIKLQAQGFEFISQFEGQTAAIGYYENFIYFNTGGTINILETETNNEFVLTNRIYCGNSYPGGITIDSSILFLSTFGEGVMIYDLSNPSNPELISAAKEYNSYYRYSYIKDTILIALTSEHAILYDISDLNHPEYISYINYDFNRNCTYAINNNVLYGFHQVGYSGPQYLEAYSVSDPVNPKLIAEFQLSVNYQSPWPDAIVNNENDLFVAFNDTIKVYDISNSSSIDFNTKFSVPNDVCNLVLKDTLMYVSILDSGVFIYNVANLTAPELLGVYEQNSSFDEMAVYNDLIFCGLGNKGFRVVNKSDTENIYEVYNSIAADAAESVHLNNNMAYFGMKESGLQIVDISNVLNPIDHGNVQSLSNIEEIESISDYIYCMKHPYSEINIVDVSDSYNPFIAGEIHPENTMVIDYCIDDNVLYLLDSLTHIKSYDLTNPQLPVLTNTIQIDSRCLDVQDNLLVSAVKTGEGQIKIELLNIENDSFTFLHDYILNEGIGDRLYQIEMDYPYVYIRTRIEVVALKISNNHLQFCDVITLGGYWDCSTDLAYDDLYIYLSGHFGGDGILLINKSDPYNLSVEQSIQKSSGDLVSLDDKICFVSSRAGYYFYGVDFDGIDDITPAKDEFEIFCYPNPSNQYITFDFALMENTQSNLAIYDMSGRKISTYDISNMNELRIETNKLSSGIYLYKILTKESSYSQRFIISR